VLAHDHVLLRQGLRRLLADEADIEVVGEADNAAECLRKVYELRPDVVIAGDGTFGLPAPEAELRVAHEFPETKILFLSTQEHDGSPQGDERTVIGDCAVRQTSAQELIKMVRNSRPGNQTNLGQAPMRRAPQRQTESLFGEDRNLTPREREVLKLLAEGKTVRAAAMELGLSSKTVDAHKFNLMRKLGIHNKAELVMWAIRKKVVKIPVNF
jgi:two-component system response regulator NreC